MEPRTRNRTLLRRAGLAACLGVLLVPVAAGTATAEAAKRKAPVVKSVSPMSTNVGQTLVIRGRHFKAGRNVNTVAFKRDGGKAVFVKADVGTRKMLKVKLSDKLTAALVVRNGLPSATQFRLRVLSRRFGKKFTGLALSPTVGPELPPAPPAPPAADPEGDCDGDGQLNGVDADDDNDLLTDTLEKSLRLDGCKSDTDGDGAEDGYEYQSARDLNDDEQQDANNYAPYPTRRPYPNPLDGTDGGVDHDGDFLDLVSEYKLWRISGSRTLERLSYSAGEQYSVSTRDAGTGRRLPSLPAAGYPKHNSFMGWAGRAGYDPVGLSALGDQWYAPRTHYRLKDLDRDGSLSAAELTYYDKDHDGWLNDAERDEDADGLTNQDEANGCMTPSFWAGLYDKETPFPVVYAGTDLDVADSDGDGIRDGADDQDHDDVPNLVECSRQAIANLGPDPSALTLPPADGRPAIAFVNPFNPCLPHTQSRTCPRYIDISKAFAPFAKDDVYWFIKN